MLMIRLCSEEDVELLGELNKQLIEDEQHDNAMNLEQLKERMHLFLSTDYQAYLFEQGSEVLGYALVNHSRRPLYLRQFFICRNNRRNGYGRRAFEQLLLLLGTTELDIEVMYWNERAYAFWRSVGFKERSIYMRREP